MSGFGRQLRRLRGRDGFTFTPVIGGRSRKAEFLLGCALRLLAVLARAALATLATLATFATATPATFTSFTRAFALCAGRPRRGLRRR